MNAKQQAYFKVLGIPPTVDKSIIKRAYRKKAFQYHPDRNKLASAHEKFIKLTEAYEFLTDPPAVRNRVEQQPVQRTSEEILAKRMRDARKRYRDAQRKEEAADKAYFDKITSGVRGRVFLVFGAISLLVTVVWFADYFILDADILTFSSNFSYNHWGQLCCFIGDREYCFDGGQFSEGGLTVLVDAHFSSIYDDLKFIKFNDGYGSSRFVAPSFGFVHLFPFFGVLFVLPLMTYFFRKPTIMFTVLYLFSATIVFFLVLCRIMSVFS